jgi:hypothetical protein
MPVSRATRSERERASWMTISWKETDTFPFSAFSSSDRAVEERPQVAECLKRKTGASPLSSRARR